MTDLVFTKKTKSVRCLVEFIVKWYHTCQFTASIIGSNPIKLKDAEWKTAVK